MRTLHQCLLDINLAQLHAISRHWDIEPAGSRPREIAAQLAEAMADPHAIVAAWRSLPDDQREVLTTLLAAGGQMPLRVFTRQWGEIRAMGPGRMEREKPWRAPISPVEGLWYNGFIARAFEQGTDGTYEVIFVPAEIRAHLPTPPTDLPTLTLTSTTSPAHTRAAGDTLLDDACTLLAYLQNEQVRTRVETLWPEHHTSNLARRLIDASPQRLAFLQHLAQRLGWLRVTDRRHLRPEPNIATAWLQSTTHEQRLALTIGWRDDPTWNDLFHTPTLEPDDTGAWHNDPRLARKAILHHLCACVPGTWYNIEGFVAAVKRATPDFQRPDGDYTTWYIRDATTGTYLSGFESWDAVEGALIRHLLVSPLAWLGLVDTGTHAFQLSQTGAAFLGLAETPPETPPTPLHLSTDFAVSVPAAARYQRFQLARVADWVRSGDSFSYRITPASLERARQQGIPVARVLDFLGRSTEKPLPRVIEAALTRWEARGSEASIEQAVLLRVSSEELMAQIVASPATRRFIKERIGPTSALISKREWPQLIPALGKLGLLPDLIDLEETHAQ